MDPKKKNAHRCRKHRGVRSKIRGTADRPRLSVFRSLNHVYAQVIDDEQGKTIAAASTVEKEMRQKLAKTRSMEAARMVGELVARRAREKGVVQVVFDRGWYKYHGRVMALADAVRAGGLKF
ncbi:MAG: 50S ribosomal protein L18 [Planctomycetes bacterium]|nr:50S ribosomal protein L18 [Planctomycetota bacterium]